MRPPGAGDADGSRGREQQHEARGSGVGLEAQATANLSFKAEYLYVDLGSQAYNGLPTVGNRNITQRFSVIRAGVNYKF